MINHKWGGSTTFGAADGHFSIVCEEELVPGEQVFIRCVLCHEEEEEDTCMYVCE